jgi:hypothetical protein
MKTLQLAAAMMTLAVAVNQASALAAEPSANNPMSRTAEKQASKPSVAPHYEWQSGYGSKGQWEGHWVLVR